jgi:hypothetical protein
VVNNPQTEQLIALNAMLQRGLASGAEELVRTVSVNIERATISLDNVARVMVLEGTAIAADLDQVIFKTAQGEFLLKGLQLKEQGILNQLPSRVILQIRPGPNGLETVLVVGNKPINKTSESLTAGTSLSNSARQTLSLEIPKIGQIHQVLVLPSSLFSQQGGGAGGTSGGGGKGAGQPGALQSAATLTGAIGSAMGMSEGVKNKAQSSSEANVSQFINASLQKLGSEVQGQKIHEDASHSNQGQNALNPNAQHGNQSPQTRSGSYMPSSLPELQLSNIKILNVILPDQAGKAVPLPPTSISATLSEADGAALTATVKGTMPSGQPVLEIGDQVVAVKTGRGWPVGTQLTVMMGKDAAILTNRELAALDIQQFDNLRHGLELMAQAQPALHKEFMTSRMPQANSQQLGGALLFFLAALQKGNFSQWAGAEFREKLESLDRVELVKKILGEWQNARFSGTDAAHGEWKGMTVPYLDQDKLQQFRFFVHDQSQNNQKKDGDKEWARRFMIEVNLTRLGPIQMEGLVQKRQLDLIVRTDAPLEKPLQKDLFQHFAKAMEEVRYVGTLIFRANKIGWVDIKARGKAPVVKDI